jgi:FtsZ-binding cell division protein ZapB
VEKFFSEGFFQVLGVLITALSAYGVARFTRAGSREANQTTGWTNLVAALQAEIKDLRTVENQTQVEVKEVSRSNSDLGKRVDRLEINRHRWKDWGRRIVEIMEERGVKFPSPPESLEDSDPKMMRRVE